MSVPDYSSPPLWEARYASNNNSNGAQQPQQLEWYASYGDLSSYLRPYLRPGDNDFEILVAGCGTSLMPADLYAGGCQNISAIDASPSAVEWQAQRFPDVDFSVMDACSMGEDIPEECFDCIIEKATSDALLCDADERCRVQRFSSFLSEAARVLKPGGVLLSISCLPPQQRLPLLNPPGQRLWGSQPSVIAIRKPQLAGGWKEPIVAAGDHAGSQQSNCYYLYVCRR